MGALALGGQQLMGQTVMVKSSEAEKNLQWEQAQMMNSQQQMVQQQMGLAGALPGGPCRLHVRNLHVAMAVSVIVPLWGLLFAHVAPLRILVARTPRYHGCFGRSVEVMERETVTEGQKLRLACRTHPEMSWALMMPPLPTGHVSLLPSVWSCCVCVSGGSEAWLPWGPCRRVMYRTSSHRSASSTTW